MTTKTNKSVTMDEIFAELEKNPRTYGVEDVPGDLFSHVNNLKGGVLERFESSEGSKFTGKTLDEQFEKFSDVTFENRI